MKMEKSVLQERCAGTIPLFRRGRKVKSKALKPYIIAFLKTLFLYIVMPVILWIFGLVRILYGEGWMFITITGGIVVYVNFLFVYFFPGLGALLDLFTDSFVTTEITHESVVVNRRYYIKRGKIKEQLFMTVFCSLGHGKRISFYTTTYFEIIRTKKYTVVYGKHSKILVSICEK
jgi:hypothetical protein